MEEKKTLTFRCCQSIFDALLVVLGLTLAFRVSAAPLPDKIPTVDQVIEERLQHIDDLLKKKEHGAAISTAVSMFKLDSSACRAIVSFPIPDRSADGEKLIARTTLDQTVILNPEQAAFKNARYLVSVLAHEITVCNQNQNLYAMSLKTDMELTPLKHKVPLLYKLADLDDLAALSVKNATKNSAAALSQFKKMAQKMGLELTPQQVIELTKRVIEDVQVFKRTMADVLDMEATLSALELPGVVRLPKANEAASEEFIFHYRYLMHSTNKLLRTRQLFGATGDTVCQLVNYVPFEMTLQSQRNCVEAVRLIQTFTNRRDFI